MMLAATLCLLTLAPSGTSDTSPAADSDWPQWRGPRRDGHSPGPEWGSSLQPGVFALDWQVDGLGPSYSGAIVCGSRVFITETVGEEREAVRAFDRTSGEELWASSWEGAMKVPFFAAKNGSWIRSTPACDGETLFVAGMRDVLVALDVATGESRWVVDFVERFGTALPAFGFVCSPLVEGDALFVQAGNSLVRLNKLTGATVWRSLADGGSDMDSAFSSPVLAEIAGREQLVVQSRSHLHGVDPESGASLWSVPIKAFRGMNILTPLVVGDSVFTSAYGGRGRLLDIHSDELEFRVEERWNNRAQGYMSSPVVIDGHAYLFQRSNRFSCVDLETGELKWTSPPTGDEYWSLAAQGERLIALSNTGRLRMIEADESEYAIVSERDVCESDSWAHLAPAGSQVFIRQASSLLAYEWK